MLSDRCAEEGHKEEAYGKGRQERGCCGGRREEKWRHSNQSLRTIIFLSLLSVSEGASKYYRRGRQPDNTTVCFGDAASWCPSVNLVLFLMFSAAVVAGMTVSYGILWVVMELSRKHTAK
eukprot:sb/3476137/